MENDMKNIFGTDKRIRLGIWGLGRGSSFIKAAKELNIDIVAGCDFNPVRHFLSCEKEYSEKNGSRH